jgi:o-succinylbenzoate synthase
MQIVFSSVDRWGAPARPSLHLRLESRGGAVGHGEATPLSGFSPDDIDSCHRALAGAHERLAPLDLSLDPTHAVAAALGPMERGLSDVPSARFALETALFDLAGQHRGWSIAECLGGPRSYDKVAVNGLLVAGSGGGDDLLAPARALAARGIRVFKVKLRAAGETATRREQHALEALRLAFPPPLELRFDLNGALGLDEARRRLEALAPLSPRFVEQPVGAQDLVHLGPCAVPWAADESLAMDGLPERLAEQPGCAAFILKPAILGGLLRSLALARLAQSHGLDVVITHLFDGPIALAAACELALGLPRPPLACGLDPHDKLAGFPPIRIPQLDRPGWVVRSGAPGLGLAVLAGGAFE